jgi:ATP synthase protein I
MRLLRIRPIRVVLWWQGIATIGLAAVALVVSAVPGAVSAALGGSISIAATIVFAALASLGGTRSASLALLAVLRAEAAKIGVIVVLLWLVLTTYKDAVVVWVVGSFLVCAVILSMAGLVRDA